MREYVCTFLFSEDRSRVLLIRKNRPAWQAGKLNGIGGKIERGETPLEAARREFLEETGVTLAAEGLEHVLTLSGGDDFGSGEAWRGYFFRAFGDVGAARSLTDEGVEVHAVRPWREDTVPNLRWMVELMLDDEVVGGTYRVEVAGHGRHQEATNAKEVNAEDSAR
jgi:8-oxo-dGTP diphosphatase